MDIKTKHRILGILVVAGLIVILLPFLQSGRELRSDTGTVKSPPFPDQSVQVTTVTPVPITMSNQEEMKQQPDDTIQTDHPQTSTTAAPIIANPALTPKVKINQPDANQKAKISEVTPAPKDDSIPLETMDKTVVPQHHSAPLPKKATLTSKHSYGKIKHLDNNGLFKLQSAAWVIQVGSYKNKANALRIVNNLRANGYRAFIQQISTALGDNTRVFVGPENKQASARELAQKLETDMHLRGMVISYTPLAL